MNDEDFTRRVHTLEWMFGVNDNDQYRSFAYRTRRRDGKFYLTISCENATDWAFVYPIFKKLFPASRCTSYAFPANRTYRVNSHAETNNERNLAADMCQAYILQKKEW